MIRYPVTDQELRARIGSAWLNRAAERTEDFRRDGEYTETSPIWSEVKPVYVKLQHEKCGFCERRLSDPERGLIEYDVEHFRPKSSVAPWPTDEVRRSRGYHWPMGDASAQGYYLMPYQPWNYLVACKPCNSLLKSNFFPVAGPRTIAGEDPWRMRNEKAFLVYPIGDLDDDPASILTFIGNLPMPVKKSGHAHRRARVVIGFFELDTREDLLEDRAKWISALWMAVRLAETGTAADQRFAGARIREYLAPFAPHSLCVNAFHQLVETDRAEAERVIAAMSEYLESKAQARGG
jgi:hypothetical protein